MGRHSLYLYLVYRKYSHKQSTDGIMHTYQCVFSFPAQTNRKKVNGAKRAQDDALPTRNTNAGQPTTPHNTTKTPQSRQSEESRKTPCTVHNAPPLHCRQLLRRRHRRRRRPSLASTGGPHTRGRMVPIPAVPCGLPPLSDGAPPSDRRPFLPSQCPRPA